MSFFNDFLENFNIDSLADKVTITLILGVGLMIIGKVKILHLSENVINLKINKVKI